VAAQRGPFREVRAHRDEQTPDVIARSLEAPVSSRLKRLDPAVS
jgi:hypothetical protein